MAAKHKPSSIYCRISRPEDERVASLDAQEEAGERRAAELGYSVSRVFRDRYTGAELWDRPALSELRAGIRDRRYAAVVIDALDRLSRDATHLAILFEEAERHDCPISATEPEIDKTPEGVLMRNIRGYVSTVERLKIADRTRGGARTVLKSGKVLGAGLARYGYRYREDNRHREIEESEAEVVRLIFERAVDVGRELAERAALGGPAAEHSSDRGDQQGRGDPVPSHVAEHNDGDLPEPSALAHEHLGLSIRWEPLRVRPRRFAEGVAILLNIESTHE